MIEGIRQRPGQRFDELEATDSTIEKLGRGEQ